MNGQKRTGLLFFVCSDNVNHRKINFKADTLPNMRANLRFLGHTDGNVVHCQMHISNRKDVSENTV